jgi:spore germination protein GerM
VNSQRFVAIGASGLAALALIAILLVQALIGPRDTATPPFTTSPAPRNGAPQVAHIRATLFYVAGDGDHLSSVVREVRLAEQPGEQGTEIVSVALEAPPAPLLSAVPTGTTVRGFYLVPGGDAYVDLGGDGLTAPGGSTSESLAVYAIVNAVTANLPSVKRVQILIEGKEVDTLAGHLDLRRPLAPNLALVQ